MTILTYEGIFFLPSFKEYPYLSGFTMDNSRTFVEEANHCLFSKDFSNFVRSINSPPVHRGFFFSPEITTTKYNIIPMKDDGAPKNCEIDIGSKHLSYKEPKPSRGKGFECKWEGCSEIFNTRTGLATHCGNHLTELAIDDESSSPAFNIEPNAAQCKWEGCSSAFNNVRFLTKHLSSHIGQMPFVPMKEDEKRSSRARKHVCSFSGCGRTFVDLSNKKKHEKTHDKNRPRFHCTFPSCHRSYSTRSDLKIHFRVHTNEFNYKCTYLYCDKAFTRRSELYSHEVRYLKSLNDRERTTRSSLILVLPAIKPFEMLKGSKITIAPIPTFPRSTTLSCLQFFHYNCYIFVTHLINLC